MAKLFPLTWSATVSGGIVCSSMLVFATLLKVDRGEYKFLVLTLLVVMNKKRGVISISISLLPLEPNIVYIMCILHVVSCDLIAVIHC